MTRPRRRLHSNRSMKAFTIVEVIVTTVVVSLFIMAFSQAYLLVESQRVSIAKRAYAESIAYTNLKKVTARPSGLTLAQCNTYMDVLTNKSGLDLTTMGYVLENDTDVKKVLGSSATQTLLAFAPSGCANLTASPIKVVSTVTFGTQGDKVIHASFVK